MDRQIDRLIATQRYKQMDRKRDRQIDYIYREREIDRQMDYTEIDRQIDYRERDKQIDR